MREVLKSLLNFFYNIVLFPGDLLSAFVRRVPTKVAISFALLVIGIVVVLQPEAVLNGRMWNLSHDLTYVYGFIFGVCGTGLLVSRESADTMKFWTLPLLFHMACIFVFAVNPVGIVVYGLCLFLLYVHVYRLEDAEKPVMIA